MDTSYVCPREVPKKYVALNKKSLIDGHPNRDM